MNDNSNLQASADILLDFLCVQAGEEVLITADSGTDRAVCAAVQDAARRIDAHVVIMESARLPFQGRLADPYITSTQARAIHGCDVWVDLAFPYFAGSHVYDEAMEAGSVRYLLAGDIDAPALQRLFGGADLDLYFRVQHELDKVFATEGSTCRITTDLGTDITFQLARPAIVKPRRCEKPGMYLVPGGCPIAPQIETVKGVIVVNSVFHEHFESLADPIVLELDGKIRSMRGGGASRFALDRALRRAGGGEYGSVIHFTHGMHPAARVTGRSFIEDSRAMGSNAVGLGLPWWEPGGGENHPDAVLTDHSVWVNDARIIDHGAIVAPGGLADAAAALAPKWPTPIRRRVVVA
ncbi:hypothetical protein [Pusillimonas noertemannii]|uniref:hypothetical protein n=1 Tax=Pusillimonas noertemannii TaxID=305977 RepID=UPI003340C7AC